MRDFLPDLNIYLIVNFNSQNRIITEFIGIFNQEKIAKQKIKYQLL